MIGDSNNEINFPKKLLLIYGQVSKLHKAFENNSSASIKLSKTQMSKEVQSEEDFWVDFLDNYWIIGIPLLKIGNCWNTIHKKCTKFIS